MGIMILTPVTRRLRPDLGLVAALASAAAFGTSGPFSKALLVTGWTPAAVVLLRVAGAALVLAGPAVVAMRGRWRLLRPNLPTVGTFGLAAVVLPQVAFVNAVSYLPVGVALLLEYLGIVLVALWTWLRTGIAPSRTTWLGMVLAVGGLCCVLDLAGRSAPAPIGVLWGLLAAVGLASYFVTAANDDSGGLPPVALVTFGLGSGAAMLAGLGLTGLVPVVISTAPVTIGATPLPAWLAVAELAVVAAALAYVLGTVAARRLGAGLASFVGLTEVLFAVLFAWLLLGELPAPVQLAGGVLIVAGVVAVERGQHERHPTSPTS